MKSNFTKSVAKALVVVCAICFGSLAVTVTLKTIEILLER